jgi:general stress protein 26
MGQSAKQHLSQLLESFDTAMLITKYGEGDHARPMAIAAVDGASTIWFVTSTASPKVNELSRDSRVAVTCQSDKKYVALSGTAELVHDRAKIEELWKETWKVWFPEGKASPDLALIRVSVEDAEFWDNAGAKGIRYVFEAVKALAKRRTPNEVPDQHGRVKPLDEQPVSSRH